MAKRGAERLLCGRAGSRQRARHGDRGVDDLHHFACRGERRPHVAVVHPQAGHALLQPDIAHAGARVTRFRDDDERVEDRLRDTALSQGTNHDDARRICRRAGE